MKTTLRGYAPGIFSDNTSVGTGVTARRSVAEATSKKQIHGMPMEWGAGTFAFDSLETAW
jgi:hypothetical protein